MTKDLLNWKYISKYALLNLSTYDMTCIPHLCVELCVLRVMSYSIKNTFMELTVGSFYNGRLIHQWNVKLRGGTLILPLRRGTLYILIKWNLQIIYRFPPSWSKKSLYWDKLPKLVITICYLYHQIFSYECFHRRTMLFEHWLWVSIRTFTPMFTSIILCQRIIRVGVLCFVISCVRRFGVMIVQFGI